MKQLLGVWVASLSGMICAGLCHLFRVCGGRDRCGSIPAPLYRRYGWLRYRAGACCKDCEVVRRLGLYRVSWASTGNSMGVSSVAYGSVLDVCYRNK